MDKSVLVLVLLTLPGSTMSEESVIELKDEQSSMNITSPNYPNNYDNNVDMTWQVIAPQGFRVLVQFNDFNVHYWSRFFFDFLSVYHGLTNSLEDASLRAVLSGNMLPDSISSIGSYLWLWFRTGATVTTKGFSLLVSVVKPDWACDFRYDTCDLHINNGEWFNRENDDNYYYILASGSVAGFKIPHVFTSPEGTLSFGHYHGYDEYPGSLNVTVCKTKDAFSYELSTTFPIPYVPYFVYVAYEYIEYSCNGIEDIEITFTATDDHESATISVLDIQIFERASPSTASVSTTNTDILLLTTTLNSEPPEVSSHHPASGSTVSIVTTPLTDTTSETISENAATSSTPGATTTKPSTSTSSPKTATTEPASTLNASPPIMSSSEQYTSNRLMSSDTDGKSPAVTQGETTTLAGQLRAGDNSALVPAVSSAIALIVIFIVLIAVFVIKRRRSRDSKTTEIVDQNDDGPNLYNNPAYCSKDDGLPIPDLLVGTKPHNCISSQVPQHSTDTDNQYEEFEGERMPASHGDRPKEQHKTDTSMVASPAYFTLEDSAYQSLGIETPEEEEYHSYEQAEGPQSSTIAEGMNKGQTENTYQDLKRPPSSMNAYSSLAFPGGDTPGTKESIRKTSVGVAVLDDDEEYNGLTFNQSSDITRALRKPKVAVGESVNDGYGVLDLEEHKDPDVSVNPSLLHNDNVYSSLNDPPQEQEKGNQKVTDTSPGYQALKLGQSNNLAERVEGPKNRNQGKSVTSGSSGSYQSLLLDQHGQEPNAKTDKMDTTNPESEYHNYQDPSQMDQEGSGRGRSDLDAFSSDQYNILDSGKQVGDYHVYQETDDTYMDEGEYEDLDSKMRDGDEYATKDQNQNNSSESREKAAFEPIYSDEVYSEFQ